MSEIKKDDLENINGGGSTWDPVDLICPNCNKGEECPYDTKETYRKGSFDNCPKCNHINENTLATDRRC